MLTSPLKIVSYVQNIYVEPFTRQEVFCELISADFG